MRKQFPVFIGNGFDDTPVNIWMCIILVENDMVLLVRSFYLDCSMKAIKLSQIDVTVDVELPLAMFVRNPPLLMLVTAILPEANAI